MMHQVKYKYSDLIDMLTRVVRLLGQQCCPGHCLDPRVVAQRGLTTSLSYKKPLLAIYSNELIK
eukprot:Ihof_evm1s1070 gene=Ihof_evmTU1s1070